jgi:hypothetical protein
MRTLTVLALLGVACTAAAKKPTKGGDPATYHCSVDKPENSSLPPLTDATKLTLPHLKSMADDLIPMIEEAAGAKYERAPIIGTTDAQGLADILESEALEVMRNLYDAPDHLIAEMARQSRFSVPGILGKYAPATGSVYLGLAPISHSIASSELEPEQTLDAACLVLAHELAHALQDQRAGHSELFAKVTDMDAFNALRGVSEGHAVYIEERVAEKLGLIDVFWELNKGQGWGPAGLEKPQAFALWGLYGQGRTFIRYQYDLKGEDWVWEVMKTPPPKTSMIFRPDTYAPTATPPPPWGEALAGVEQKLTRGDWAVVAGPVGEYDLRGDMAGMDADAVNDILGHLVVAQQRDLAMPNRAGQIRILEFDEADAPYQYIKLLEEGQQAMADAMSTPDHEWSVEVVPYDTIEGDAVIRRVVAPVRAHSSLTESQSVWVVRGQRLVVVHAQRFRPGLRMDHTLEEVFARLEAAEKK